jgi:hypothetical protein
MTIDQRITRLEKKAGRPDLPGTTISRILYKKKGFGWTVGVGAMHLSRIWFHAKTIESALSKAEKHFKIK